jgi:hypothetical protein
LWSGTSHRVSSTVLIVLHLLIRIQHVSSAILSGAIELNVGSLNQHEELFYLVITAICSLIRIIYSFMIVSLDFVDERDSFYLCFHFENGICTWPDNTLILFCCI